MNDEEAVREAMLVEYAPDKLERLRPPALFVAPFIILAVGAWLATEAHSPLLRVAGATAAAISTLIVAAGVVALIGVRKTLVIAFGIAALVWLASIPSYAAVIIVLLVVLIVRTRK